MERIAVAPRPQCRRLGLTPGTAYKYWARVLDTDHGLEAYDPMRSGSSYYCTSQFNTACIQFSGGGGVWPLSLIRGGGGGQTWP